MHRKLGLLCPDNDRVIVVLSSDRRVAVAQVSPSIKCSGLFWRFFDNIEAMEPPRALGVFGRASKSARRECVAR
jgi:hypothetical protein